MAAPSNSSQGAQVWCYWCTSATPGSSLLSTKVAHPLSWAIFYFLVSWRTTSPSSTSCSFLFFFKLDMASNKRRRGVGTLGLVYKISTRSACTSFSSSSLNWSISSSTERLEEAISSLEAIALGTARVGGNSVGTTSFQARNSGTETSILQSLRSPTLITWPISWKLSEIDSKSKIRWTSLSYYPYS